MMYDFATIRVMLAADGMKSTSEQRTPGFADVASNELSCRGLFKTNQATKT